jgi:hypothetical protein
MALHDLNTPPDFLAIVRGLSFDNIIGLDPCSNATSYVDAETEWCEADDGLSKSWRGHGLVFMNPPHSMSPYNIEPWMEKAYNEFIKGSPFITDAREDQFVGLVPAKTDTAWFHAHARHFGKCFLRGRLKYWQDGHETPGPGKFGSLVLYAGSRGRDFQELFRPLGWVV